MSITRQQVAHIARLSRLKVEAEQAEFYAGQLSRIMELVEQMNRFDTAGVQPMSHPQSEALRLRDDRVAAACHRQQYQRLAAASARGLYLTPKVID